MAGYNLGFPVPQSRMAGDTFDGLVLGGLGLLPTLLARVLLPPQDSQGWYPDAPPKIESSLGQTQGPT